MEDIKITFTAMAQLVVNVNGITGKGTPEETNIRLDLSPGLDESKYLSEETVFTAEGSKIATIAFCQALIGNIHIAHENGFRDSAEHLRDILDTITNGFAALPELSLGYTEVNSPVHAIPKPGKMPN